MPIDPGEARAIREEVAQIRDMVSALSSNIREEAQQIRTASRRLDQIYNQLRGLRDEPNSVSQAEMNRVIRETQNLLDSMVNIKNNAMDRGA